MAISKTIARVAITFVAIAAVGLVAVAFRVHYWRSNPDRAFEQIVGRPLPAGVHASRYTLAFNDTMLHVGHYWLLSGSTSVLHQVPREISLTESTEDARAMLPDMKELFDQALDKDQVVTGYEGGGPRNDWYWVFSDGPVALYEHN